MQATGPWALFRLFAQARLTPGDSPERFTLTFQSGERAASFDLRANSLFNPFATAALQDFRCPVVQ